MYHVELRQFPHNFCRFNLTERELRDTILDPWARGEWIELGERKWNPQQANLTVLESPRLPVEQLSMGRGWPNAKRQGQDVTKRLLPDAGASAPAATRWRRVLGPGDARPAAQRSASERAAVPDAATGRVTESDARLTGDSLGLQMLAELGTEPAPLATVWWLARERYPELPASDCLKLAELAVRSLADAGLAVVLAKSERGEYEPCAAGVQVEQALRAINSWSDTGDSAPVLLRKV